MTRLLFTLTAVVFAVTALAGHADHEVVMQKEFDSASVKPNTSTAAGRMLGPLPGGRFVATNVTLRQLVAFAFGVSNARSDMSVIGGPSWIDADRFDIDARVAAGDIPRGQTGALVLALLEERFQLRAHRETRDRPIYHLVVDRLDGRLGSGLRLSTTACGAVADGVRSPSVVPAPRCGLLHAPGSAAGLGVTISQLAEALAPFAGRVVVDRTDLKDAFDIDLKWTPDVTNQPGDASGTAPVVGEPGLFTALREQLGLRFDSARGPVETVVVDAVSRLTPN